MINRNWIGTFQAAAVVRGLYLTWCLRQYMSSGKKYSLLDAGSGEGAPLTVVLARRYTKCNFVAIDLYPQCPSMLENEIPQNVMFLKEDLFEHLPVNKYDFIYCLDVLEHIKDYEKLLRLFYAWIKPKGKLVLHVPSINQTRYLLSHSELEHSVRNKRPGDHHVREGFYLSDLVRDIIDTGFNATYSKYTFAPFTWFLKEIYSVGEKRGLPGIGLIILPFIWLSTKIESLIELQRGNGIFIVAKKPLNNS
jgi:2-polyprenyl-3-methyl-5-hydroxy-6-metoxy-1,4-benzoquinol methylase